MGPASVGFPRARQGEGQCTCPCTVEGAASTLGEEGTWHPCPPAASAACGLCPLLLRCVSKPWVPPEPPQPELPELWAEARPRAAGLLPLPKRERPSCQHQGFARKRAEVISYLLCLLKPTSLPNSTGVWEGSGAGVQPRHSL